MAAKPSVATPVFERLLRAFDTGGFTYADFLDQLEQLLASGASPVILLEALRRHESIEPLPDYARLKVVHLLNDAVGRVIPPSEEPVAKPVEPAVEPVRPTRPIPAARSHATTEELAAARSALEAEQIRASKLEQALAETAAARETERIAARVAAHARGEEVLREASREVERHRQETQNLRDAADAREVELSVLQQERDALIPALEKHIQIGEQLAAELEMLRQEAQSRGAEHANELREALAAREADGITESELRTLRGYLSEREAAIAQAQRLLGERDTELAALRLERDKLLPALQARTQNTTQLEVDLQTALTRAVALNAELAAAQAALESEQRRGRELDEAWADKIASSEAARRRSDETARDALRQAALDAERYENESGTLRGLLSVQEASLTEAQRALDERDAAFASARLAVEAEQRKARELEQGFAARASSSEADLEAVGAAADKAVLEARQQAEHLQVETRTLRDSLAARDAAIVQVKHLLGERNTQLAVLQKEQAKTASSLEAQTSRSVKFEADLAAVGKRADAVTLELQSSKDAIGSLSARAKAAEASRAAAQAELEAVTKQSSAYLELLRSREWRHGYDQNQFRESDARVVAPAIAPLTPAAPVAATRDPRVVAPPPSPDTYGAFVDRARAAASAAGAALPKARVLALAVAVVAVGLVAWVVLSHGPAPTPVPSREVALAPPPAAPASGTVISDCSECPGMTVLPVGRFKQGSAHPEGGSSSEQPLHWVAIRTPFAMATNLVTVDEFKRFVAATGRDMQGCDIYDGKWKHGPKNNWASPGFSQTGQQPVTCVSWTDAEAYAQWLSSKTGHRYRLPSASEWEYAARVGAEAVRPWATDAGACANANVADASGAHRYPGWVVFPCNDGFVYTAPVGSFKTNAFGLNDMLGNVFQWTQDCWHPDYTGAPIDGSARRDGDCTEHELRGGSWFSKPAYVRANYRNHFAAGYRTSSVGIRLVRDI